MTGEKLGPILTFHDSVRDRQSWCSISHFETWLFQSVFAYWVVSR